MMAIFSIQIEDRCQLWSGSSDVMRGSIPMYTQKLIKELAVSHIPRYGRISSHANGQIRSFDSQAFLNNAKKKNLQNMQLNRQT